MNKKLKKIEIDNSLKYMCAHEIVQSCAWFVLSFVVAVNL